MEFSLEHTTCYSGEKVVELHDGAYLGKDGFARIQINSIEELLTFVKECGHEIVIGKDDYTNMFSIEVYDTWRE